ncbi:MAG TPA: transporter associated domain-containing protein [Nevskiaceae bacterium]|nr:transporter associated domain-containing protein [Nevskiaceae bacterium]
MADNKSDQSLFTSSGAFWRKLGQKLGGGSPRSRAELLEVLKEARDGGVVDADALAMFVGALETSEIQVRDIMVPRAQMVVVRADWPLGKIVQVVTESGHSRFPVVSDSKDQVVGILLAKDLLKITASIPARNSELFDLNRYLRPNAFVPESKRVNMLLKDFRGSRNHMAIVVDEYGGVAGLVTIEDVLEQIVGPIADEYDESEGARILKQDERRYQVHGLTTIPEFNRYFSADFSDAEFDTVGGLVIHRFGHMPRRGESVKLGRFTFNVQRADSRRVHLLQVTLADT